MNKIILPILFSLSFNLNAQVSFNQNPIDISTKEIKDITAPELKSFAEATQWADLVAVAQVDDIEYEKIRDLNAKGYAFLNILVPYKGAKKDEPIAVIAMGFEENACYYPDRVNEGERFLVFLKKAPGEKNNVYYGFKPYCQLQILLSETGQYILRTPLDNKVFDIDPKLIEAHQFNDPHAMIDTTLWTSIKREEYANEYQCKIIEKDLTTTKSFYLRYTQGVPIYKVRPLLKLVYKARITSKQI
jgi:hypothetical protein